MKKLLNAFTLLMCLFFIWYGYKTYGLCKYRNYVNYYGQYATEHPSDYKKLNQISLRCDSLNPKGFFTINP